jgi:hypothetical protein
MKYHVLLVMVEVFCYNTQGEVSKLCDYGGRIVLKLAKSCGLLRKCGEIFLILVTTHSNGRATMGREVRMKEVVIRLVFHDEEQVNPLPIIQVCDAISEQDRVSDKY